jgi:hypothetical protein
VVFLLLLQVGLRVLDAGLVQAVDDRVLTLSNKEALNLAGVLKADLADGHAAVLLEVGPRRVDDGNIILLVALDRVRLSQLAEVRQEGLRDVVPGLALL